eukprot:gene14995-16697_t
MIYLLKFHLHDSERIFSSTSDETEILPSLVPLNEFTTTIQIEDTIPTSAPISSPPTSRSPTEVPTTRAPTIAPSTRSPTREPTSRPPTTQPSTRTPTLSPSASSTNPPVLSFIFNQVQLLAGTGSANYTGNHGAATSATLNYANIVWADTNGNAYISDTFNCVIRKISNGIIMTLGGIGTGSYASTVGSSATPALSTPLTSVKGIMMTSNFYLYFCEGSSRVRVTYPAASYFPTVLPTTNPTSRPPTRNPTTRAPSSFPTTVIPSQFTNQFNRLSV